MYQLKAVYIYFLEIFLKVPTSGQSCTKCQAYFSAQTFPSRNIASLVATQYRHVTC